MRVSLMRLLADRYGNFGVLTALAIVPLLGAAGIAVDYGSALEIHSDLMGAADAAALGAIAAKSPALLAAQQMKQDGEVTVGDADGKTLFLSQRDVHLEGEFHLVSGAWHCRTPLVLSLSKDEGPAALMVRLAHHERVTPHRAYHASLAFSSTGTG